LNILTDFGKKEREREEGRGRREEGRKREREENSVMYRTRIKDTGQETIFFSKYCLYTEFQEVPD
jgi:hypothetical protein